VANYSSKLVRYGGTAAWLLAMVGLLAPHRFAALLVAAGTMIFLLGVLLLCEPRTLEALNREHPPSVGPPYSRLHGTVMVALGLAWVAFALWRPV
jgi:hypothetical protein